MLHESTSRTLSAAVSHFHKLVFLTNACSAEAGAVCTGLEGPSHIQSLLHQFTPEAAERKVLSLMFNPAPPPRAAVLIPRLCWLLSPVLPRQAANGSR